MTENRKRHAVCRICGEAGAHEVYTVLERMFGTREPFEYFQCSRCECLQIAEIPGDPSKYYLPHYYSFTEKPRRFQGSSVVRALRRLKDSSTVRPRGLLGSLIHAFFPNRKLLSLSRIRLTPDSRILDVGCGDGWRLRALREIGFRSVLGVDPFLERDVSHGNGVRILKQTIHEVAGEWDVIMYHHSFEHVPDPLENLRAASRLLSAGGCCLVRIPTVSSHAWRRYGAHWFQIDAPRHLHLHSIESLKLLAERTGLVMREVVYDSTKDQFQVSESYARGIPLPSGGQAFPARQVRAWKRRARHLNLENRGDQAAFYLVRKQDVPSPDQGRASR